MKTGLSVSSRGNAVCRVSLIVWILLAGWLAPGTVIAQEQEAYAKESLVPTRWILFGSQDKSNSDLYKGKGWHANEKKHNWTDEYVELFLPLDPGKDAILDFQLVYPHEPNLVRIHINGHDLGYWDEKITGKRQWEYHKKMLLPHQVLAREWSNKLVLTVSEPKKVGALTLGLPIMSIAIQYVDPCIEVQGEESRSVHFFMDMKEGQKTGDYCYYKFSGWIYCRDKETRGQQVYLRLEGADGATAHYSTIPMERLDVGAGFNNRLYDHSGFSASIPVPGGTEIHASTIRLVVKNKDGTYVSPPWKAMSRPGFHPGKWTVFVALNWLLVVFTCVTLLAAIWRDRSLLVKPSIMAILFFHVMCQWGTALQAGRIELFLPRPWIFMLLSHGFPMIGLAVSLLTWRGSARNTWQRIINSKPVDLSGKRRAMALLAVFFVLFIIIYLSHVPFRSTGLYSILVSDASPVESALARERSVTLLDSALLRYGHNIMMAVVAPLLAVLAMQLMLVHWQRGGRFQAAFYLACLAAVLVAASISGARAYSAYIIMFVFFAWLLQKGFPIKPIQLVLAVIVILALPTLLSILREGKAVTVKGFFDYLSSSTLNRVVIVPMVTGLQHVHYAQTYGVFSIQAIPKLAKLRGIKPLDVPNFIARVYYGDPMTTMTANTSYVYAYYSYFGLIAFVPCLLGLWLLDLSLLVYQCLSVTMLLPCVACISIAANKFSGTEYTISFFTFGFLFILLVSWAVDRAVIMSESVALKKKR